MNTQGLPVTIEIPPFGDLQLGPYQSPHIGPNCGCLIHSLNRIAGVVVDRVVLIAAEMRAKTAFGFGDFYDLIDHRCPNTIENRRRAQQFIDEFFLPELGYESNGDGTATLRHCKEPKPLSLQEDQRDTTQDIYDGLTPADHGTDRPVRCAAD